MKKPTLLIILLGLFASAQTKQHVDREWFIKNTYWNKSTSGYPTMEWNDGGCEEGYFEFELHFDKTVRCKNINYIILIKFKIIQVL